MKNMTLIILALMVTIIPVYAEHEQNEQPAYSVFVQYTAGQSLIDEVINQYENRSVTTSIVTISESMLKSINTNVEDSSLNVLFERLSGIKIIMVDNSPRFFSSIRTKLGQPEYAFYEDLMLVTRDDKSFRLLVNADANHFHELLLVFQDNNKGGMISLKGNLTESDIRTLRERVDLNNIEEVPGIDGW